MGATSPVPWLVCVALGVCGCALAVISGRFDRGPDQADLIAEAESFSIPLPRRSADAQPTRQPEPGRVAPIAMLPPEIGDGISAALHLTAPATLIEIKPIDARQGIYCGRIHTDRPRDFVYLGLAKLGALDDGSDDFLLLKRRVCNP